MSADAATKTTGNSVVEVKPAATRAMKKRSKKKRKKAARESKKPTKATTKPKREFPIAPLEEAMLLAQKIKEINQGNDWSSDDAAKAAYGVAKSNNKFFYAATASRDYGLTTGGRDTKKVRLEELGRKIVFAHDREQQQELKLKAFLNVPLFRKVFEFYKGNNLPQEAEFRNNALQEEFGVHPEYHEEFSRVYEDNCRFLGIEKGSASTHVDDSSRERDNDEGATTVVGVPKTGTKTIAFVAMPFNERSDSRPPHFFNEVLTNLITPAGVEAGFTVETARKDGSDVIHSTIIDYLINADLVVADLTDHNPNVLFELGVRIAIEKPVALIKAKGTGPVFDVDGTLRILEYNPNLWKSTLENDVPDLTRHLLATWDNRKSDRTYMQILRGGSKPNV